MRNQPIHWSEGLFLRPHHLQAADRYWHELVSVCSRFDNGYNYGFSDVEINVQALENQVLELNHCHARFPDGTILSAESSRIDRVNLTKKRESDPTFEKFLRDNLAIKVFLGIPQLRLGRNNFQHQDSNGRFLQTTEEVEDESSGGNPQEIQFKDLNVKLLFETDDLSGYEVLPLCQLYKSSEMDGRLTVDPNYYPPILTTRSWSEFDQQVMKEAYDLLNHRADYLRRQVVDRGVNFSSQMAGATERLLLLQAINESLGVMSCLSFADGVHPLDAYTALCQTIGRLSVFGQDKANGDIPNYDHDDLHTIFTWALERIRGLINIGDEGYVQRFLKGDGGPRLRVSLDTSWFSSRWSLFLGIHSPEYDSKECLRILDREISWKIASSKEVDFCFEKHARGLKLRLPHSKPDELPRDSGWNYFAINEDDRWESVVETATIAVRFKSQQIQNLSDLANNQLVILETDKARLPLEMAVFAVRVND